MSGPAEESLAPAPRGSAWGRSAALVYGGVVTLAFSATLWEVARGTPGFGSFVLSVATAPWSVLLASVPALLHGRVPDGAIRAMGLALAVVSALLNAWIAYGMGARFERDARDSRKERSGARERPQ